MNSREEFHMNIFDILCTSTQGQNFAEGQGHSGNDVIYTRSHWELDLVCHHANGQLDNIMQSANLLYKKVQNKHGK